MRYFAVFILIIIFANPAFAVERDCGKDMNDSYNEWLSVSRINQFNSGAITPGSEAEKEYIKFLKERHDYVTLHEEAHAREGGRHALNTVYYHYSWWGIKYRVSGCVYFSPDKTPLETQIRMSLAPEHPSTVDIRNADQAKKWATIKVARQNCKKITNLIRKVNADKFRACITPYRRYEWLDKVPMR